MMFPNCLKDTKQAFFLQRREPNSSNHHKSSLLSPNPKPLQKISLKNIKSVKSHRTFNNEEIDLDRQITQRTSLKLISNNQKNFGITTKTQKQINSFCNPFSQNFKNTTKAKTVVYTQQKIIDVQVSRLPKISITFDSPNSIKRFISPQPTCYKEKIVQQKVTQPIIVPMLDLKGCANRETTVFTPPQEDTYVISVKPCLNQIRCDASCENQIEEDMKSTHVGQDRNELKPYFPSKPKSTVSMMSARSQCESVVMGHDF